MALVKPFLDAGAFVAAAEGVRQLQGKVLAMALGEGMGRKGEGGGGGGGRGWGGGGPRETVKSKDGVAHDFTCEVSARDG